MCSHLNVALLGDFRLEYAGACVTSMNRERIRVLLAYLLLRAGSRLSRQHIAFTFWPDSTEHQARTNLRQLLHHLKKALPNADCFLEIDEQSIRWRADAPYTLDMAQFSHALTEATAADVRGDAATTQAQLEQAVQCYRGDLLPGCYEDWIAPDRERLRQQYLDALARLSSLCEAQRDYRTAARYAELLVQHDPVHERAYRDLMRLYALLGDRARALQVYCRCVNALRQELGVAPDSATQAMYGRLLAFPIAHDALGNHVPGRATDPPLVGRRAEWAQLVGAWQRTSEGRLHLITIAGEAGVGKTRLANELLDWAARQVIVTAVAHCYVAEGRLAYAPVTDWLRTDALRRAWSRLAPIWLVEVSRLVPELRADWPQLPVPEPLTEEWQRRRFLEAQARAILAATPALLLLDDVQWCDKETLEWLRFLSRFDPVAPLLVITTVRSEDVHHRHPLSTLLTELRRVGQVSEIVLGPLDCTETAQVATAVLGHELDDTQVMKLYRETEGNPLFIVESVRAGLLGRLTYPDSTHAFDSSQAVDGVQTLPPQVQAVLAARLAQLSPAARDVAGLAAVIGRVFQFSLLAAASDVEEGSLAQALDELWQRRIVREQGLSAYDFSHDKLREAAYAELPPAQRRLLHRRVAEALERLYAADLNSVSGQIAAHYERAGMATQAIIAYQRGAAVAQQINAHAQASQFFRRALALLDQLPPSRATTEQELALCEGLGTSLVALHHYAHSEVIEIYTRAGMASARLGMPLRGPVLRGLAIAALMRGETNHADDYGKQLLVLAVEARDPVLEVEAHYVLGATSYWRGTFTVSCDHLERAVTSYDAGKRSFHVQLYAQDPGLVCPVRLALTLWYLGYPDQARRTCFATIQRAYEVDHPISLIYVLSFACHLLAECGDIAEYADVTRAFRAVLTEHNIQGHYLPFCRICEGYLRVREGKGAEGIDDLSRGLSDLSAVMRSVGYIVSCAFMARACLEHGAVARGRAVVAEGLSLARQTGQHYCDVELHRLEGELLLAQGAEEAAAERCFVTGLDIARTQQARSLELRVAMSIARLRKRQGRRADGLHLLQPIYGWFRKGLETPDMRNARRLLDELAS